MNRREFIKTSGIGILGISLLPQSLFAYSKTRYPSFDPQQKWGGFVFCTDRFHKNDRALLKACFSTVYEHYIEEIIPPQYRGKIRFMAINPKPSASEVLAQRGYFLWKYDPQNKLIPWWKIKREPWKYTEVY